MTNLENSPVVQSIPDSLAIRQRMAELAHEQNLLRAMLKLSRQKEEVIKFQRQQQGGVSRDR